MKIHIEFNFQSKLMILTFEPYEPLLPLPPPPPLLVQRTSSEPPH